MLRHKKYAILVTLLIALGTALFGGYYLMRSSSAPSPSSPPTKLPLIINGSVPYWEQEAAVASFRSHVSSINQLSLFWYYLNDQGKITKYEYATADPKVLAEAKQQDIKTFFTLTNLGEREGDDWDSKRVESVIHDGASRDQHINDILEVLQDLPFDGVNIDYEEVATNQRENYTKFIEQLANRLHEHDKLLSLALHPISDGESEKRYYFQDYPALAHAADFVAVMAYGEHYDEGPPGPIASTAWLNDITGYMQDKKMPLHKVLLGVPLYGYDWTEGSDEPATGLTYRTATELLSRTKAELQWDDTARAPFFRYTQNGQSHEVWFENAVSAEDKLRLAHDNGLGGVAFWYLGDEDPDIWPRTLQFQ